MGNQTQRLQKIINTYYQLSIGTIRGNLIRAYWYEKTVNFGDLLTPEILRYYGLCPIHTPKQSADLLSIGSILDDVPENYCGIILGSGLKKDVSRSFAKAKIIAVRGMLTQNRINAPSNVLLGDPGLLSDRLVKTRKKKQYVLGFVPHFFDKFDERIHKIQQQFERDVLIIDVQRPPRKVIADIDQCEYIISSSLHGLVVADSLGIPNAWVVLSDKVQGKGFKFYDYASACGKRYDPIYISENDRLLDLIKKTHNPCNQIDNIKRDLESAYHELASQVLLP